MKLIPIILLAVLVGCAVDAPPELKPSIILPAGTKIITETPSLVRETFGVDEGRTGKVVELTRPLVLTEQ